MSKKTKQVSGRLSMLFNFKDGSSKEWNTSVNFELYNINEKGFVKSNNIDDLIDDENKVRPVRSVSYTFNGETFQRKFA